MAVIYLAGKISKNCWRHEIVDGDLRDHSGSLSEWPVWNKCIFDEHDYCGPFFVGCDHGCYHNRTSHGVGADADFHNGGGCGVTDRDISRLEVHANCVCAISKCTHFFAWIDSTDCYGTIYEIGIAFALGKKIGIGHPVKAFENSSELWLCCTGCSLYPSSSPVESLRLFVDGESQITNGYVYFIEALGIGHIKIGWSINPLKRLAQLQTGSAARLQLLGYIPGKKPFEQKLHKDFAHLCHHDEWFHGTEELRSYIQSQCLEVK